MQIQQFVALLNLFILPYACDSSQGRIHYFGNSGEGAVDVQTSKTLCIHPHLHKFPSLFI